MNEFRRNEMCKPPAVYLSWPATKKILSHTLTVPGEVRGWGAVKKIDSSGVASFHVTDIMPLLKQDTTEGKTIENDQEIADLFTGHPNPEIIKFQWHSHGAIHVGFSRDDIESIESYDNGAVDYVISLVINKQLECICRVDMFNPFRFSFLAEVFIPLPIETSVLNTARAEILEKVSFKGKRIKPDNLSLSPQYIIVPWKGFGSAWSD